MIAYSVHSQIEHGIQPSSQQQLYDFCRNVRLLLVGRNIDDLFWTSLIGPKLAMRKGNESLQTSLIEKHKGETA